MFVTTDDKSTWSNMVQYGPIWSNMVGYWSKMVGFGPKSGQKSKNTYVSRNDPKWSGNGSYSLWGSREPVFI